jgi:hypothetical protein
MINHFRCLLVNVSGKDPAANELGDEIIDPSYIPIELPTALQQVRSAIFGPDPDRLMLNYRAAQLISLVRGSRLVSHLTALDKRVTYFFTPGDLFGGRAWQQNIVRLTGTGNIAVRDNPVKSTSITKLRGSYSIVLDSATEGYVERTSSPTQKTFFNLNVSPDVPLRGSDKIVSFVPSASGTTFVVDTLSRPPVKLADLCMALASLGEPTLNNVFGIGEVEEPLKTFRSLFFESRELIDRLVAFTCAFVYACEKVRNAES